MRRRQTFEGTHDFSTFRSASCSASSPIKRLLPIKLKSQKMLLLLRLSQNHLQNQVRSMWVH